MSSSSNLIQSVHELGRLFPCGFHNSEGISRLVESVKQVVTITSG